MTSVRCGKCSLVNFTTADACKRCGSPLVADEGTQWETNQGALNETYAPQSGGWMSAEPQVSPYSYYEPAQSSSESRSRKSVAIVVAALLCVVAAIGIPIYLKNGKSAETASLSWTDYSPEDGSYSISMPGEPKNTTLERPTRAGTQQLHMTSVELGDKSAFGVIYSDMPPDSLNMPVDKLLDATIDSMSSRQGMVVLSRKEISLDGYTGMEVYLRPPPAKKIDGSGIFRLYWVPPRVYIMAAGGPDSPEMTVARTKFLDSFKLLKK